MPPASQTDVGWIPPEVKKKLKEQEKAEKAAEAEANAEGKTEVTPRPREPRRRPEERLGRGARRPEGDGLGGRDAAGGGSARRG